ncbi:unnamed protein product [Darwinula stevensoni]|uniref:Translin-associated factor X-interacting protein 1 N-terminal domain-containing protein n=1 Tax=Darwinula stevensoni TaxID=69355 RepID=A0A7R9FQ79_9CRUS|nr:unnamed protein product [Darwinula stevensoni]CAG0898990.1 unnamed protein product [Darwinula stevensoni]
MRDLEKCSRQLSILQTDYNQVIPLREFQELEASHLLVVQEKARLRRDLDLAKTELATALQECEVLKRENATLSVANRSLSRYGTPRPDWEKSHHSSLSCMECLESSQVEEWKKQGQKRSSREKLLILLRLVCSTRKPEIGPPQFFQGKGTGPGVPRYLRFEGLVRNRHLAPRDACLLIQDIWKGKCELKESPYKRIPLETYLGSYFEERYPKKFIRMEWSYNLIDACQRFPHDDVIGLFWGILCGKYDEEIYHSQRKIVQRLKKSLKEAAKQVRVPPRLITFPCSGGEKLEATECTLQTGGEEVSIQAFIQVLRDEYPAISLKDLRELLDEAKCELKLHSTAKTIPFLPLVTLTDEGKAGGFLALLWKHRAKAQEEYVQDIGKALSKHKESSIGPYELSRALATVDPQIADQSANTTLKLLKFDFLLTVGVTPSNA